MAGIPSFRTKPGKFASPGPCVPCMATNALANYGLTLGTGGLFNSSSGLPLSAAPSGSEMGHVLNSVPAYRPKSAHIPSIRRFTSSPMLIGRPQLRVVSPGHLLVASSPSFEPSPDTGLAKSR